MERGLVILLHSVVFGIVIYDIWTFHQQPHVSSGLLLFNGYHPILNPPHMKHSKYYQTALTISPKRLEHLLKIHILNPMAILYVTIIHSSCRRMRRHMCGRT